ncbi:MAG: sulfurtransferase TusA family protein [Bacillota bacterium]
MKKRRLDLCGEVCPYTFVKALLVLEEMEPGETVDITVDYPPAASNVPRSLALYGHEVLGVIPRGQGWLIVARKGPKEEDA